MTFFYPHPTPCTNRYNIGPLGQVTPLYLLGTQAFNHHHPHMECLAYTHRIESTMDVVGLFFTIVEMKGPNKQLNNKHVNDI